MNIRCWRCTGFAAGRIALTVAVVVGLMATADPVAAEPKIRIDKAWARPGVATAMTSPAPHGGGMGGGAMRPTPGTSAIYMVIRNDGSAPDRLVGAVVEVARTVELHQTKVEGGMARMMPVPGIDVPAKGRTELKPGGLHVMLIGLKRDLKAGDKIPVTLRFQRAGEIRLTVEVRAP